MGKNQILIFHKPSKKKDILLCLQKLIINNNEIQRESNSLGFGVLLDQYLLWKEDVTVL